MKRICLFFLIALLLSFPVLSIHAENGMYVYVDDGLLTEEQLEMVNARAVEIAEQRGVGLYYFYFSAVEDLSSYMQTFAAEHVSESNALVLGFNTDYYYFLQIGPVAKAALPDSVCDGTILDAYRAVKGDPQAKLLAYLNAANDALETYFAGQSAQNSSEVMDVPSYIALTDGGKPTLIDREHLLTDSQAEALSIRLKEIGTMYRCDVVIVTVPSLGAKTSEEYADDYFDYNGYGYGAVPDANGTTINGDGILLLLSMENRDFAISTSGYGITAFTDYGIQSYLESRFLPYLSNNHYNSGLNAFADGCEYLLKTAREGVPYDVRRIYVDGWTDDDLLYYNDRAESILNETGIGIYFLESAAINDADEFLTDFSRRRVSDSSAVLLVSCPTGYSMRIFGNFAKRKFPDNRFAAILDAVAPYLDAQNTAGALDTYFALCERAANDYAHILTNEGVLSDSAQQSANSRLKQLFEYYGVAFYYVCDPTATDPSTLAIEFVQNDSVYEWNAVVLGTNGSTCSVALKGDRAQEKFSSKQIARLVKDVTPYLNAQNTEGAIDAFAKRSEKILKWTPINWIAVAIAAAIGLLLGGIPVFSMKRQMTNVSKQTGAERYMWPSSFTMTQSDNILLNKNVTRSVHVVQSSSGGGSRPGGGGSSFHGGSSTHSSSSGGTHGGHSGKF